MKKVIKKLFCCIGTGIAVLVTVFSVILSLSISWMFQTWNNLTMDELIYHLQAPLEGTNKQMVYDYLNVCVAPAMLVLLFLIILFIGSRKKRQYYFFMGAGIFLPIAVSIGFIDFAWENLDISGYVRNQGVDSVFIEDNYVDPREVELTFPKSKRNLIYIFLESMETTYADKKNGGAFDENYIPELMQLAQDNEDFSGDENTLNGGYSMPGSTWTMGAMFAQTSGLPLDVSIDRNSMDTQDSFFANVMTLGDVLNHNGYTQTLMIGSGAAFGGRKLYFTEHGGYNIMDYDYAIKNGWIPPDYRVWWGYEDEKLFEFSKIKLLELSSKGKPFNFTMLTADTHFEDGYVCGRCPDTFGKNQYANVMACSSEQVDEFVSWIQHQSFYENTTIVVVGDHPTMDSDFCKSVNNDYVHKVYTSYINAPVSTAVKTARLYTTFDFFPTTLASLGVSIKGDRLGLGTNLFSDELTLTERFGINKEQKELSKKSKFMEELADLDKDKVELLIREGKGPKATITAGTYNYRTGALPVSVTDITNVNDNIQFVMIAVWTAEDRSDLQWIQMEKQQDGSYFVDINIPNFGYKTGKYHIQAYMEDSQGTQYRMGETIGVVD